MFLLQKDDEVSCIFKVIDVFLFVPTDVFVRIDFMIIGTTPSHTSTTELVGILIRVLGNLLGFWKYYYYTLYGKSGESTLHKF